MTGVLTCDGSLATEQSATEQSATEQLATERLATEQLATEQYGEATPSLLRDLVPRARAGDEAAREELADRSGRAAYGLALQLLRNPAEAQDVAQDTLLKFFSSLDRFDESRPVLPWLFRIVRNRAIDSYRRGVVRRGPSLDTGAFDGSAIDPVDPASGPHENSVRLDLQRRIWQCLRALSVQHREILVLRDYQDLSYREISEVLDIPQGTVMSRLHAARKKLRQQLLEGGWVFGGDDD